MEVWRRSHGGEIIKEKSWRRNHGGEIWRRDVEEKSWRRHHRGEITEENSWRRNDGGEIMEEKSWRRNHGSSGSRSTQEAPRRHPGGLQEPSRGTQEISRRHPRGPKGHPETHRGHPETRRRQPGEQRGFEGKCVKTIQFLTKSAACAQRLEGVVAHLYAHGNPNYQDTPPEPLQQTLIGG